MILEYLFFEKSEKFEVQKYNDENISPAYSSEINSQIPCISYKDLDNSECWIVKYEISSNNEQTAKQLSEINEKIYGAFSPTILTNESSEYYNKALYPIVNKFERNLRKLLYLKAAFYNDEKIRKILLNIEEKDFGKIYEALFVDTNFRTAARKQINNLNTRSEMIDAITNITEHTVWDSLIGDTDLKIIKDNFYKIKEYRNDVMHAHNIGYERFKDIKKLFSKVNEELSLQINSIIEEPSSVIILPTALKSLCEKLSVFNDNAEKMVSNISQALDVFAKLSTISISPEISNALTKFAEYLVETNESVENDIATPNSSDRGDTEI